MPLPSSPTPLLLHFVVEDTGTGIEPDELESLFEPFIQSKHRAISQEGTGLGLPISRQFVQLMRGHLTVESRPGVGSSFGFTIPVQLADLDNLADTVIPGHILGLAPNQPSYRVLVVEDNEPSRQLLMQLLQTVGFEVQTSPNGQEAIAHWQTWQPHLIWMDMRMPVMDGYVATQQIRARERARERLRERAREHYGEHIGEQRTPALTKIIALTANAFEEDRARVLAVGCDDFVRKPFQASELLEKMADHLGVQYLYAEAEPAAIGQRASAFDPIASLRALPPPLLAHLHQATIQLDSVQLTALIEQLAPDQPTLATLLTERLDSFDLERILNLLQAAMQNEDWL